MCLLNSPWSKRVVLSTLWPITGCLETCGLCAPLILAGVGQEQILCLGLASSDSRYWVLARCWIGLNYSSELRNQTKLSILNFFLPTPPPHLSPLPSFLSYSRRIGLAHLAKRASGLCPLQAKHSLFQWAMKLANFSSDHCECSRSNTDFKATLNILSFCSVF